MKLCFKAKEGGLRCVIPGWESGEVRDVSLEEGKHLCADYRDYFKEVFGEKSVSVPPRNKNASKPDKDK